MKGGGLLFFLAVSLAAHAALFALISGWPKLPLPLSPQTAVTTVGFVQVPATRAPTTSGNAPHNAPARSRVVPKTPSAPKRPLLHHRQTHLPHAARSPLPVHRLPKTREKPAAALRTSRPPKPPARRPKPAPAAPSQKAALPKPLPSAPDATTPVFIPHETAAKPSEKIGGKGRPTRAGAPLAGARTKATPSYAANPPPIYPAVAQANGWEGEVLLMVEVTAGGKAGKVTVEHSSGHAALDRSAVRAVLGWRFHPARIGTTPVPGQVRVPIRFELHRGWR